MDAIRPDRLLADTAATPAFLEGGGEMGRRIRAHDWATTPLGPIDQWPGALRTTLRILLTTNHPVFVFWGPQHICLYNDAYARSLGPEKHPSILGTPAREAWQEVWPSIGPQIEQVLAGGGATWHENQPFSIVRHGRIEEVYWTYSYGPIDDASAPGGIGGVLVLCTETTQQVLTARRLQAQQERWRALFDQAPGFMCVLAGPEHRYEYANHRYLELVEQRAVIGRSVAECLPEVKEQGFVALLDEVYRSGRPHVASTAPITLSRRSGGPAQRRYLDFVYQPIRDDAGHVSGIFVEGQDVTDRTEAARALSDTLASIADAFAAFDSEWRYVYVNAAAERLVGRKASELLGRTYWEVFPATLGTQVETEYRRAAAGEIRQFEHLDVPGNRWFDIRCYPRAGGGMALYVRDITAVKLADIEQRAVEQRARERAEELEALMNSVPACIWIAHDPRCASVSGSLQAQRLVDMAPDANASASAEAPLPAARPFREYIGGRPAQPHELPMQRACSTGQPVPAGELTLVFDDGRACHLYGGASPLHDASGRVRGAIAAFVDITALKDAQQRLEARERELRTLTDNTPDILARFDRAHRHVFINAPIERVTGLPPSAFLNKTNQELGMPAAQVEQWDAALRSVFDSGQTLQMEFELDFLGQPRHYLSRLVPERAPDGQVLHVLSIVQDVTDRRRAELAVRDAERRKDEFLATLAHELRNPLAPLRTGLNILERLGDRPAPAGIRTMMNRQLTHMVRLIDDLLDVARISAGKMTLRREWVTLQSVADTAVEASRPAIDAASHRLEIRRADAPAWVHADPTRLAQVVGNLLNNACKYTPAGGRIVLALERKGDRAVLSVTDDGIGIPPAMLSEVFQMFAQVNTTLNRAEGGLGIGLALARSVIELHDGTIEAASPGLGGGSCFTVTLPAVDRVPVDPAAARVAGDGTLANAPRDASGLRVLVVDDNRDAADTLAALLQLDGHDVRLAYDGIQARTAVDGWPLQVAFVDIGMPGLDGYEVARHLRGGTAKRQPTLVAVTGWGTAQDELRSRRAGFDHHLTKPVSAEALRAVLRGLPGG